MTAHRYAEIRSPVDGEVIAEFPLATRGSIQKAFNAAWKAQKDWRRLPVAERARTCHAAVDAMLAMEAEIVPELARQMGRPVRLGGGELRGFEERARAMIAIAEESLADIVPEPKPGFSRRICRIPWGVVFVIAPWNYPYLTAVNAVIPALMAGNAVILKHATQTLLVGERFQEAFDRAGLPKGLFRHLILGHYGARELIGGFADMVCFTGSVAVGERIEEMAAGGFIPVGLELGGKDPAYVRADADLAFAIENVADGAFFNSGQSCCAVERIYVHEDVYDDFVEGFVEAARAYVLGDPLDEATMLGPMAGAAAAAFVRKQVRDAVKAGARSLVAEKEFARSKMRSPYLAPQVLVDVDHIMSVMREESFGPVAGIMKVSGDEEAIQLMNDSKFGLTASIWTADEDAAEQIGDALCTGTVYMNRCDYLDPALAWTGVKQSGRGVTLSRLGYEQLTRPKSFHFRTDTGR